MQKNDFKGLALSSLGMGMMRLPLVDGDESRIDMEKAQEIIDYAIAHGINYFDTAWGYHGGNSEHAVKTLLGGYPRESYYLASKFPGYDVNNFARKEEIFEAQLQKCGTEYFDFYLFHNVTEKDINEYLDPKIGLYDYLMEQKRLGRIRHLGFSGHGKLETLKRFLDAYGKDMEFAQIQLNWLDWNFQDAKAKVELLREWNIPVWVMEPVRGGRLMKLSENYAAQLRALHPDWSLAEWAFRYLQGIKGVTVTLSGMSNMAQIRENIAIYETEKPLSQQDMDTLMQISREVSARTAVPCTGCRYCTAHCPQELGIPELMEMYNEFAGAGALSAPAAMAQLPEDKKPASCIGCRACEQVCPQNIRIANVMQALAAAAR